MSGKRKQNTIKTTTAAGYRRLARAFGDKVYAPAPKPRKHAPAEEVAAYKQARRRKSSRRICVEHADAEHRQWRALQRYTGITVRVGGLIQHVRAG